MYLFDLVDRAPPWLVGLVAPVYRGLALLDAWLIPGAILYWISTWPGHGALLGAVAACGAIWWGLAKTAKAVFAIDSYRWSILILGKWGLILMITAVIMRGIYWAQA